MRFRIIAAGLVSAAAAFAQEPQGAYAVIERPGGSIRAPLFSEEYASVPVAQVDNRVVTLAELSDALASSHSAHVGPRPDKAGKKDYTPVLDRLIGMRLIFLEAHDMGLDELPDVKEQIARFEESAIREELKARVTKAIEADPAEVERMYKDSVREWKVHALLFDRKEQAKGLSDVAQKGGKWEDLAKEAVAARQAKPGDDVQLVSTARRALPQVLEALRPLREGGVTAPVPVGNRFAVMHVDAVAYPDDAKKRQEAVDGSRGRRESEALAKYYEGLVKREAVIDRKLLDKLDFEAKKPGFQALLKDKRVLAKVKGGPSIAVADLAKGLNEEFFHGVDRAISEKKVNARKVGVFNAILYEELFTLDARRLGIAQTPGYLRAVANQRDALIFGKFVEKVILPDVRITEGDLKTYYDAHQADYTYPAFYTLSSIAFDGAKPAQAAFLKLKGGTDFKWLKSNAAGQLPEDRREIEFDGTTVSARGVPPELSKLLSGTRPGDLRLYAAKDGANYLVQVGAVTPARPQPYAEAREEIAPKVQRDKVNRALEDWIAKLRKAREVKIFITRLGS